jgi:protein-S-isoprenylcysteine O-methyltransferase Ste14
MKITDSVVRDGDRLFRWRSYAPLLLLPILLLCLRETAALLPWADDGAHHVYLLICYGVSGIGLLVRWAVIAQAPSGTSGRCTSEKIAEQLNTRGLYSAVRHPLYVGNFIAMLGVFMATMLWWAVLFFVLAYWLYIERIMAAEERFLELKFGNESRKWANTTPAFFPSFRNWSPSRYPVSIRNILRREYHGVLAVAFSMVLIEFVVDVGFQGQSLFLWAREDRLWLILLAASVALYLLLRALKKHTALLDNPLV